MFLVNFKSSFMDCKPKFPPTNIQCNQRFFSVCSNTQRRAADEQQPTSALIPFKNHHPTHLHQPTLELLKTLTCACAQRTTSFLDKASFPFKHWMALSASSLVLKFTKQYPLGCPSNGPDLWNRKSNCFTFPNFSNNFTRWYSVILGSMFPIHNRFPSWATLSEMMEAFSTVSAADDMCSLLGLSNLPFESDNFFRSEWHESHFWDDSAPSKH